MSDKTGIEWTDATWNPLRGCSRVSEGCRNCYAETVAARFCGPGQPYEGLITKTSKGPTWNGTVKLVPEALDQPIRWRRPRRIFVNSMSDLFHEEISFEFIAAVFGVMSHARQHTFQVLTKRPDRMLNFFSWLSAQTAHKEAWIAQVNHAEFICGEEKGARGSERHPVESLAISAYFDRFMISNGGGPHGSYYPRWPLPNAWLGVSVEDQQTANARIPLLLQTPAAVRWISAEPLLDAVDISGWIDPDYFTGCADDGIQGLHWVVVGGESGKNARPMHPDWARSLRDQCREAGVAFVFKQWGEWEIASITNGHYDSSMERNAAEWVHLDGVRTKPSCLRPGAGSTNPIAMIKVGKKAAGRMLDGRTWDEYPEVPA